MVPDTIRAVIGSATPAAMYSRSQQRYDHERLRFSVRLHPETARIYRNAARSQTESTVKLTPLRLLAFLVAFAGLLSWSLSHSWGVIGGLLRAYTLAVFLFVFLWLASLTLRRFLWRVSRRLTFSYFLFGLVPISLVLVLTLAATYVFGGFFIGHLYRDGLSDLGRDLDQTVTWHLAQLDAGRFPKPAVTADVEVAYYKQDRRFAGSTRAPEVWPSWAQGPTTGEDISSPPIVAFADGTLSLMAAARKGRFGVLAFTRGDLDTMTSRHIGIWTEHFRPGDQRSGTMDVRFLSRDYTLKLGREAPPEEIRNFLLENVTEPGILDLPYLVWVATWSPFRDLSAPVADDEQADFIYANLTASPRALLTQLVTRSAEIDALVYLGFAALSFLLFDIYVLAALLALLMITGLSRAVNRLTDATQKVQQGDFSARIDVRRNDQIGALQSSFNSMAENLEALIREAASKEILEKDLSIAKELHRSLLPDHLGSPSEVLWLATHFEPSSAIGGDYFDFLRLDHDRILVVIADASGHGISAGLRMAMVKSALQVLAERQTEPLQILRELHSLLRKGLGRTYRRSFVTATLGLVETATNQLILTNAGHPPTYLLRDGEVEEIILPSPPLGALGNDFNQTTVPLEPGDLVVWLSDGLIEATDAEGDDFGYNRVVRSLRGLPPNPARVRDTLLEAVRAHTGGQPPEDDRTLVVMAYRPADTKKQPAS